MFIQGYFLDKWLIPNINKLNKDDVVSSVAMIDINDFKYINDTYGHLVGDKVLIKLASILSSSVRNDDYVVRFGGDEFLVILTRCDEAKSQSIINRVQEKLKNIDEFVFDVEISYGIS